MWTRDSLLERHDDGLSYDIESVYDNTAVTALDLGKTKYDDWLKHVQKFF